MVRIVNPFRAPRAKRAAYAPRDDRWPLTVVTVTSLQIVSLFMGSLISGSFLNQISLILVEPSVSLQ
jgi:hypothetical protein